MRSLDLLWHSTAPWSCSGYGTQSAIWIRKLTEMGHRVTVSAYWGLAGSATQWEGITILPGWGASYCSPSLQGHYRALQPDFVITLGDIWVLDAQVLRRMRVAHWLPCDCRPMSTADRGVVDAGGGQLIAMSRFGEARFVAAGYSPLYVPHGVDTSLFAPPEDRDALRKQHGLDGAFVVGMNAANNDALRKAIPEQMLAFARFQKHHPDAVLALHSGVHQDGGQDLEALAENLGIGDRVRAVDQYRYHSGFVTAGDMTEWYGTLDVLSACAQGEGFGLPVLEAQSCGVPVISTDASAMTELNPLGVLIRGEPFWNGVHKAWWIRPSIAAMTAALEEAYERRGEVDRGKLREFALQYDASAVAEEFMAPAIEELAGRFGV